MQRFTRQHLRFLWYKIFRFQQAQQSAIIAVVFLHLPILRLDIIATVLVLLGTRLLSVFIRHFERVWSDHD